MRNLLVLFLCVIMLSSVAGNAIKGTIADENKRPVEFANILLHQHGNTDFLNGATSDSLGQFSLDALKDGNYFLEVVYVGYKTDTITDIQLENNATKDIGEIALKLEENILKGVEISASRPTDRKSTRLNSSHRL